MEKILYFFLGLLAISYARVIASNRSSRIVNGTEVKPGEIPFQVSLQKSGSHFCGGSILSENYVVTAAHCVDGESPVGVEIVAGTVNYTVPGQKRQSANITVHAKYSPIDSHRNDIALIKLGVPFKFNELIQPVALPKQHAKIQTNSSAVVSGWGRLGGNIGGLPQKLQKAQIYVADPKYCRKVMQEIDQIIYPTHICANDPSQRKGQCNGDSGGPLIVDGKLTGIVSWSIKDPSCASTTYPGVYTRVTEYVDWIFKHAV